MTRLFIYASSVVLTVCPFALRADADSSSTQPTTSPTTQPQRTQHDSPALRSLFDFEALTLELGFESAYDRRHVTQETRTSRRRTPTYRQTNRATRFEETLGLRGSGSLIDEKVATFDFGLEGGWTQEHFEEVAPGPDRSERPDGSLFNYDLDFTFFPRGKLSASAYAKRLDSRVPRAFQPSLDRTLERYGAGLYFSDPKLPMRLTFEHTWDELTSRTADLLDDEQRGRDTVHYEATWQIDQHHSLRLDYEYVDRREEYSGTNTRFDTTRHYLTLQHTLQFGHKNRSRWETLARFQEESGDLARDNAEVSTRLRLQHDDKLSTNWAAQFLRDAFEELTTTTWRGEGGIAYEWDKDFVTSMQLYGLQQQVDANADILEWGGLANVSYARENAWGRFSTNLSYNYVRTDTHDGDRGGIVIAEAVTFRDPLLTYLAQADVDPRSIIVTDATRARTYLGGRDFIALQVGRYTALRRLPNGNIADRETVLVSYTYRARDDYDLQRHRIDFRMQQQFEGGLKPYYALSIQDEELDNPNRLRFAGRNVNRHRIGLTYEQKRWSVGVEYEYNDDAVDPYQAIHANGDVVLWHAARNQLDGKTTFSRFWFDGSNELTPRDTTLVDAGLSYRHLLARDLEANASAMYRYEDDSLFGVTHGIDLTSALEWRIGYFSLRFEAEYDVLDLPGSRDDTLAVWIKLKREIPLIERRRR